MAQVPPARLKRPFRSPVTLGKFPVLADLGLITSIAMLSQFSIYTICAAISVVAHKLIDYRTLQTLYLQTQAFRTWIILYQTYYFTTPNDTRGFGITTLFTVTIPD